MLKKTSCIFFMMIFFLLMISCEYCPDHSLEKTKYYDAYAIMNASVPLYRNSKLNDSPREQYDTVELMETDSYGRKLYRYQSDGQFSHSLETWLVSQKTADGIVYYDRDVCWISVNSSDENFKGLSDEEIQTLKQNNMWEQPLDESSWASVSFSADLFEQHVDDLQKNPEKYAMLCQSVHVFLGLDERYEIHNSNVLILDDADTMLMIAGKLDTQAYKVDPQKSITGSEYYVGQYVAYYLVLYHPSNGVIMCEELSDIYDCNDVIAQCENAY